MNNQHDFRNRVLAGTSVSEDFGSAPVVAHISPALRAAFLRKVYLTLTGGVAVAMAVGMFLALSALQDPAHFLWKMVQGNGRWMLLLGYLALSFMVSSVVRIKGVNILAFLAFTAFTGFFISPLLAVSAVITQSLNVIWQALGLTVFAFGGLTGYVLISGKDFSFMKGFVWTGFWILLGFMVMGIWINSWAYHMAITAVGLLVFVGFVLYDTSNIMHRMMPNEWVAGAFSLFIDFINMFIRVLILLTGRRD